ncbi:MAG: ribosome assembly cofactor RimP [Flavobacteriales bacterium]|jgi:ribosome maturation factor RimP|nr:ribosome assembly cofactor RimP [Flavobacteriales bacterium]
MIKKEVVKQLAQERMDEMNNGTYLVDIMISNTNQIVVEIDNMNGGAAVEDCIRVSRNIEHNLDREQEDFELQVTTPGLSNPFKVEQQYIKNIGRNVKVVFKDVGSIEGKLVEVNAANIVVETATKERIEGKKKKELVVRQHPIEKENIKETKIVISFK